MANFWAQKTSLEKHVDQHNRPESSEFTKEKFVSTQTVTFASLIWLPHNTYELRRVYLSNAGGLGTSTTNYWSFSIIQKDNNDKEITLAVLSGSDKALVADKPQKCRIPANGSLNIGVASELPIFLKGVRTGSPSVTGELYVELVLALK